MFAFEHGDIVPDIVTSAKGLTSAHLPLGVMAVSDDIAKHFQEVGQYTLFSLVDTFIRAGIN